MLGCRRTGVVGGVDQSGDMGDDGGDGGVTEGTQSQFVGRPINQAIHSGFACPVPRAGPRRGCPSRHSLRREVTPVRSLASRSPRPPRSPSVARGVGHSEQPGTCVWGAHLTSPDAADSMSVSQSNKVSVDDVESPGAQAGHVLPQHPLRSKSGDDGDHAGPRPPRIIRSETETSEGDGLAGETPGDQINGRAGLGQPPVGGGVDVVMEWHLRVVVSENGAAERITLDLTDDGHPGSFQPEIKRGDPGEQRQHVDRAQFGGGVVGAWRERPTHWISPRRVGSIAVVGWSVRTAVPCTMLGAGPATSR